MNIILVSGQILGNVLAFAASGLICTIPFQNGWPLIFYIFGKYNTPLQDISYFESKYFLFYSVK